MQCVRVSLAKPQGRSKGSNRSSLFPLQVICEKVVNQVWDTTTSNSVPEELAYFSALEFALPSTAGQICAIPLEQLFDWLLKPHGPALVEGDEVNANGQVPHQAFALLAEPSALYTDEGMPQADPFVGIGVVFIPPCMKKISFTQVYINLNQWR